MKKGTAPAVGASFEGGSPADLVRGIKAANQGHSIGWTCVKQGGVWRATCTGRRIKGLGSYKRKAA
ncbi:hypothetical protein [Sansalvadorimonas verongulae]|uniref:hypothetical protein n=1 Tax=Sansalvadorimonas verongulae TaxID=2172824 RepID=UPI0012BC9C04|nr:hypothetical protein [Sansalvadorimonas verongulae]MTI12064.1 hypothetical protein [Sansalvadorimonas verongulae]